MADWEPPRCSRCPGFSRRGPGTLCYACDPPKWMEKASDARSEVIAAAIAWHSRDPAVWGSTRRLVEAVDAFHLQGLEVTPPFPAETLVLAKEIIAYEEHGPGLHCEIFNGAVTAPMVLELARALVALAPKEVP